MRLVIATVLLTAGFTCPAVLFAAADNTEPSAAQDLKSKFYELLGKDTASISFTAGSATVSEGERKNLAAVVAAVRADANIATAIVAAWSDKNYPESEGQELSKADRKLAYDRAKATEKVLQGLGVKSVEIHSMAERPTWLGKLFNTEDAKLKGEGVLRDANDQLDHDIGKILRNNGGPGRAVVVVRREGDRTVH